MIHADTLLFIIIIMTSYLSLIMTMQSAILLFPIIFPTGLSSLSLNGNPMVFLKMEYQHEKLYINILYVV